MRRIAMFLPVLCCLALVAQQSAARDDATKDKSKEWKEGSVWEGIGKTTWPAGNLTTGTATLEITKRDGKSFEGRSGPDENNHWCFEGKVDADGEIKYTITKLVGVVNSVEWMKGPGRNIVGCKGSGTVDGKSVTLKLIQPDPDHPKNARIIRTSKLKLKTDD
jgi:hypothetical protein